MADGPLYGRTRPGHQLALKTSDVIFIVGAGRSGTTWLHLMLGAHPQVATGQESQLFNNYLRKLVNQWNREIAYPETDKLRKHGITSYIDEDRFMELLRDFAIAIFDNVMQAKPGATRFLEKSPNNSFNIDLIHRVFPDARFVHLIRDGRDVVTSMLAAKKSWGKDWAPDHGYEAGIEWVRAVTECRRLHGLVENYCEVRYKDLLNRGPETLARIYEFLELPLGGVDVEKIYAQFAFDKLKKNDYSRSIFLNPGEARASGTDGRPEPRGFFRKGVAGDWQVSLNREQVDEIYWAAGELLEDLGYIEGYARPDRPPRSIRRRLRIDALKNRVRKFGARFLN
jgi:Sulfotransferase family